MPLVLRQIKFATGDISLFPLIREGTLTFTSGALKEVQIRCLGLDGWILLIEPSNKDSSQKQRKVEKVENTSGDCLVQNCCSGQGHLKQVRPVFSQVLNISKDGDPTTSLGYLFQGLITPTIKKIFRIFK